MRRLILYLLDKVSYKSSFGLSLADELKVWYYWKIGQFKKPERCFCGGIIHTYGAGVEGWITECLSCRFLYDED